MQTFYNQLIFFAFFQCLFLLAIYLFSSKNRKNLNGYIVVLVAALLFGLGGKVIYISEIFGKNFRFIVCSELATLLFGTTVFLFTRSSLRNQPFKNRDLVHYILPFFYSLTILFYFVLESREVLIERQRSGEMYRVIYLLHGFALVVNSSYVAMSLYYFFRFRKKIKNELSYSVETQFFLNFLIAIASCIIIWIAIYFISLFGANGMERDLRQFIWLTIAFIILFIAYYSVVSPDVFKLNNKLPQKKYASSKLSISDLDQLKSQLELLMEEKKPFLNNKLMKAELAEMLGVSNPELARLLNERIGMNFFDFVNYYRIKEFINLAKKDDAKNYTFFGLAQEAGFNSKTTFNKSFKKLMGSSPTQYFKEV